MRTINLTNSLKTTVIIFALAGTASGEIYVSGELTEDTTWSGTVVLEETVMVPAGMVLNIEPGTIVSLMDSISLIVYGQLIADGNETEPIRFTHYEPDTTWKQIMFIEAMDSRFTHCIFEYADCEGAHQDYYEPGPRNYHEAIVALATHLDFEGCTFQNLPDGGNNAEGDALAIISDDPNHPGQASATFRDCQFLSIGQGVHTRFSYVLVEDCFFTGKHGDNDDVDLWGESTPAPVIRNNLFLNPEQEDMINPTRCSAVITGNVIIGSDDHGVVLRDKGFPVVMNNLIVDCSTAGIAIENSCEALLVNNTIVDCGRGLRLFDLGRWGPPYRLNPGGGTATVINCIIWNCSQPVTLDDSSSTEIEDTGSHITISYSDIPGGRDGVIISGTNSTLTWEQGNINIDPQFADPANGDYHLKSQVGRYDPENDIWVMDKTTSPCIDAGDPNSPVAFEPFPNGGVINMGAYGGTVEASKSPSGINGKYGGGTGEPNDPYLIYTAEQMNTIGAEPDDWDKQFKLMADIDLSGYKETEFNIIGTNYQNSFKGVFDGNGHSISNFTCKTADAYFTGLFGRVRSGIIKDLELIDANVDAEMGNNVGSLVGMNIGGTISGCSVLGGFIKGGEDVGGLVGCNDGTIINCCSSCIVDGNSVGGLAGSNSGSYIDSVISMSYSKGTVSGNGPVGGLVGQNGARVLGHGEMLFFEGLINNCYSTCSITGNTFVGGLVGFNEVGDITHCYSNSVISGNENAGGFVGENNSRIDDCFWDIESSGQTTSAGGIGKTTAEMQTASTFLEAGWDFVDESENGTEDIWWILEGRDYPRLFWELTNN
jgi:hypothetical protein